MSLLFDGQTFLVASDVLSSTVYVLEQHGGSVVRVFGAHVTCGVVADAHAPTMTTANPVAAGRASLERIIPSARCFRALRLPVVYESWVHACVAAQTLLPCRNLCALEARLATRVVDVAALTRDWILDGNEGKTDREAAAAMMAEREDHEEAVRHAQLAKRWRSALHSTLANVCGLAHETASSGLVAYDPLLLDGVQFTTTQLPQQIKANVVAALQFLGASYSPHLTTNTRLVVYSDMVNATRVSRVPPSSAHTTSASSSSSSDSGSGAARPAGSRADRCDQPTVHTPPSPPAHCASPPIALSAARSETPHLSGTESDEGEGSQARHTHTPARGCPAPSSSPSPAVPLAPTKLNVARALDLLCVTPSWVQQCLRNGTFPTADTASTPSRPQPRAQRAALSVEAAMPSSTDGARASSIHARPRAHVEAGAAVCGEPLQKRTRLE